MQNRREIRRNGRRCFTGGMTGTKIVQGGPTAGSKDLAALDEANEQNDHGNYQQDVNEASHGDAGNESKQPEDYENDGDGV